MLDYFLSMLLGTLQSLLGSLFQQGLSSLFGG